MSNSDHPVHVLCVDDKEGFADMAATLLEREDDNLSVDPATSAQAGLDDLETSHYDCVVSDYDMPGMSGIEFLEAVRESYPELPFILFTGKGSEEIASDAISAGVTDYLQKSTDDTQYALLANRVRNAVEKYRTQSALSERELRLELFFEESPLGIIEWNEDFEYQRVNEATEEILGYSASELWGESWEITVPEPKVEEVRPLLQELLESGESTRNVNPNIRKDGEYIICEWHNQVVTDEDDEVVAIFSLFQDVTERERQDERFQRLVDSLPGMVYRCRNDRGWPMEEVRGDVEGLLGYSAAEVTSRGSFYGEEVIHPDDRESVWEQIQAALDADDTYEVAYRIESKAGAVKQVWERGQGVVGVDGSLTGLEGFITDFTGPDRVATNPTED